MMLVDRLLPGPTGSNGNQLQRGRDSESRWTPRVITALTDKAAVANNEL